MTSACPSRPVTVPTRSCAWATAAPATTSQSARSTARSRHFMPVRREDLRGDDAAMGLVDRDVRVVDGTIVGQGDADIRGDRALDADRELADGVLPARAEIRRAVGLRIVLVAEQVGDVDRRAPAG